MHRHILALIVTVVSLGTAQAAEDSLTIVGGLDLGFKRLRLDTGSGAGTFDASFVTLNPGIVLAYSSFYASLSYDKSISADPDSDATVIGGNPTATVTDYSRTDSTLTLGYRLDPSFSVFAGYTEGVNRFMTTTAMTILIVTDTDYTEKGPFAGVSYTHAFGDKGGLGLSVGYAKLNGDLKTEVHPGNSVTRYQGDTTGLSYGLTWSGPLVGSLSYRLALKETRYEMKDPIKLTERYTSFFLGVVNYF